MSANSRGIQAFEDLVAWQKARELTRLVFQLTDHEPLSKRYRFCDQLQAAAISIMNNIAEGFDRNRRAEFSQFLTIAKGSCGEVRSMLYVALDARLIDLETFERLHRRTDEVARLIAGLRATVDRQRSDERSRFADLDRPASRGQGDPSSSKRSKLEAQSSKLKTYERRP
ncbi:MAG: hypothetical protein KatS3mg059_0468 [Thermomicrobiales bacterium]|nr:MAG: hypothetical protein KatS3mg059_0468 [Thermomicrobiales bacterium]